MNNVSFLFKQFWGSCYWSMDNGLLFTGHGTKILAEYVFLSFKPPSMGPNRAFSRVPVQSVLVVRIRDGYKSPSNVLVPASKNWNMCMWRYILATQPKLFQPTPYLLPIHLFTSRISTLYTILNACTVMLIFFGVLARGLDMYYYITRSASRYR